LRLLQRSTSLVLLGGATGWAVLLFEPESWRRWHRSWFRRCALLTVLAAGWYAAEAIRTRSLPGGSSWPGLVCGVVAGLLMLYLFAFGVRKWPVLRLWFARRPAKQWLAQHIWLGLLTLPLVVLHAGLFVRLGTLTLALVLVYAVAFVSGLWGLWQQQRLPRQFLEEIPDETIRTQIPELLEQLREEADLLVLATCGASPEGSAADETLGVLKRNQQTLKAARAGKGTGLLRLLPVSPIPNSEPLRHYFREVVEPYLLSEGSARSRLRLRARLKSDFIELRGQLRSEAHPIVDALERLCEQRQQFDRQARLHDWLHGWIAVHLACSAVLMLLLVWHAVTAVLYW